MWRVCIGSVISTSSNKRHHQPGIFVLGKTMLANGRNHKFLPMKGSQPTLDVDISYQLWPMNISKCSSSMAFLHHSRPAQNGQLTSDVGYLHHLLPAQCSTYICCGISTSIVLVHIVMLSPVNGREHHPLLLIISKLRQPMSGSIIQGQYKCSIWCVMIGSIYQGMCTQVKRCWTIASIIIQDT